MVFIRYDRVFTVSITLLLAAVPACSSAGDAPPADEGSAGDTSTGAAGSTGSDTTGSAGNTSTAEPSGSGGNLGEGGVAAAGHGGSGGTPGQSGNATPDAGHTGSGGSIYTGDAATIDVQIDGNWKVAPLPAVGTPGVTYLSDMTPTKVAMFDKIGGASKSGPMHNDVSFNGKPLVINGVYYAKGIGVHTYAQITYALGGQYTKFVSDTGLDFLENSATMIFEVNVDDKLVYDNGNGTKTKDQVAPVSLDVTGKQTLMLYVRDGFDDSSDDFGVWGGARLLK
jgi:hypothetical protein